jgi:hypothetical protein
LDLEQEALQKDPTAAALVAGQDELDWDLAGVAFALEQEELHWESAALVAALWQQELHWDWMGLMIAAVQDERVSGSPVLEAMFLAFRPPTGECPTAVHESAFLPHICDVLLRMRKIRPPIYKPVR